MASFVTPPGVVLNTLNGKNLRNMQKGLFMVSWLLMPNEVYTSARIIDPSETHIPKGLNPKFTPTNLILEGTPSDVDEYHPAVKSYEWSGLSLDGTEFKSLDSDEKATIEDIKNQDMHYSGKSWGIKGITAYYRDGNILRFPFDVEVNYMIVNPPPASPVPAKIMGSFFIIMVPNIDPKIFCEKYGAANGFTDDKGNKVGFSEYKSKVESQGFDFLSVDRSQPV